MVALAALCFVGCQSKVDKAISLCEEYEAKMDKADSMNELNDLMEEFVEKCEKLDKELEDGDVSKEDKKKVTKAGQKVGVAYASKMMELSN